MLLSSMKGPEARSEANGLQPMPPQGPELWADRQKTPLLPMCTPGDNLEGLGAGETDTLLSLGLGVHHPSWLARPGLLPSAACSAARGNWL